MIRQLSVFVENQPGSIMRVTSTLTEAQINIRAISSFDAPEFAILRLVVDKPEEAKDALTTKGFVVRLQDVISVELKDEQGSLNKMLKVLADNGNGINYIYSFVIRGEKAPVMVFHTDRFEEAESALQKAGIKMIEEKDL